MSIAARIGKIEGILGGDGPRRIIIHHGPDLRESWIERRADGYDLFVPTPSNGDPMERLTASQRGLIRPGDSVVTFEVSDDGRDPHLQLDVAPGNRRPYRMSDDGSYELEGEDGNWVRHEFEG